MELLKDVTGIEYHLPFDTPVSLIISGSSFSGKTTFAAKLIQLQEKMFSPAPVEILYVYTSWQPLYDQLEQAVTNITFVNRIPSRDEIDTLTSDLQPRLIVLDDKMTELAACPHITDLFTVYVHHRKLSCILLLQNIFYQGAKCLRDITLNVQGLILFKNKRSPAQIGELAKQMFPGSKRAYFLDAYSKACSRPFGYLFIDLSPLGNDKFQLRTNILPGENTIVYLPSAG